MEFVKKKSLGQNFLKDKRVLAKIASAAEIAPGEIVLEIGPGEGDLTAELLQTGAKVLVVEKDHRLIPILTQKFKTEIAAGKLILIHSDILDFNPSNYTLNAISYKLVANIPYYITGEILRQALSKWPPPKKIVLLIQKEVARRIVAHDKKESLLSISVKIFGEPKIIDFVKAGAFNPAPKVDSAILAIDNISKSRLGNILEEKFFEILKAGFAHKRKIISANLKKVFDAKTAEKLSASQVPLKARAEDLTLENWLDLAKES